MPSSSSKKTDNPADNLRTTLQNLLQLAEVATPRPWKWGDGWDDPNVGGGIEHEGPKYADCALAGPTGEVLPLHVDHYDWIVDGDISEGDRDFIAQSANLAPALARFVLAVEHTVFGRGTCWVCDYQEMNPKEPWFEKHEPDCPLAQLARELEPQKAKARDQ